MLVLLAHYKEVFSMANRPRNRTSKITLGIVIPRSKADLNKLGRTLNRVRNRKASFESVMASLNPAIAARYKATINELNEAEDIIISLILNFVVVNKKNLVKNKDQSIKMPYLEIQWRHDGRGAINYETNIKVILDRLNCLIDGKAFRNKPVVPRHDPQKDTMKLMLRRIFRVGHGSIRITVLPRTFEKEAGKQPYSFDCALPKRR